MSDLMLKLRSSKFMHNLGRIYFDLIGAIASLVLVLIFVPETYFPETAKAGFVSIIITKFILITLGNVHFFITRHLMFSYIDFSREKEWSNNVMVIVMYAVIVWCWARGG